MATLENIRQGIIHRDYYLSSHAEEEMLDDNLERKDVGDSHYRKSDGVGSYSAI
uniref:Uncharacterized protein n=1 Tax=Candidatus Kentrum sp. MB TaxID=2138164 RepID=A0A450XYI3_9GAMM|nr:MAG: hypothetical protein BECKMB1821G_GA0114241_100817 [Candidatus Kentron sp. MB]VFK34313.1 MAG: hypothetical protein BECKMB1821I_GA0114274_106716 [Candidatus Kentron sp. MB]